MSHKLLFAFGSCLCIACSTASETTGESVGVVELGLGGIGGGGAPANPCAAGAATRTVSFQNGVNGYVGEGDTYIDQHTATQNHSGDPVLKALGAPPGQETSVLVRWPLPSFPLGTRVCSSSISLYVSNATTQPFEVFPVSRDWLFDEATWNSASATQAWAVPGATGATDRGPAFATITPSAPRTLFTTTLPTSLVHAWVNSPASNRGVMIASHTATDELILGSRWFNVGYRPQLTITVSP